MKRTSTFRTLGEDLAQANGTQIPTLTDPVGRKLSVSLRDIGNTGSSLVPLENIQLSTSHFEFPGGDRRPTLRFAGWAPSVTRAGLWFGSTGMERAELSREQSTDPGIRRALEVRLGQIDRLHEGLSPAERTVFRALPLDLSVPLPSVFTGLAVEPVLQALKVRGFAETDDHVVWRPRGGCLWFKNSLIGRRYCVYCLPELGKCREIETGRPRATCPRCGRENPYVGQSLPRSFSYYSQTESLDTAHVTRASRYSPIAALSDEHKEALLLGTELLDLRLPRDAYAERVVSADAANPINVDGVRELIVRWAGGWVPFAARSPVTGMVSAVGAVSEGLAIDVAGVRVVFDMTWIPLVGPGSYVNAGDELAIPLERPKLNSVADFGKLPGDVQRYLWTQVGESSWLVVDPPVVQGCMVNRTRAYRVSGLRRLLFPVQLLRPEALGRIYVDVRDCRIGQTYAVDAGVLLRQHIGGVRLNVDALLGPCYNFYHSRQRLLEARVANRRTDGSRPRLVRAAAPVAGIVRPQESPDDAPGVPAVIDRNAYEGAAGATPEGEVHEQSDTRGATAESGSVDGRDAGAEDGSGPGPDLTEAGGPADGGEGQGADGGAGPGGFPVSPEILGADLEGGRPEESTGHLGDERELAGVAAQPDPGGTGSVS